ncbi:MAG: hypothetical protein JXR37_35330 [Kiritimatiellae bacterium]|nr:hypothetical protein [Kiritimatiellia bacterium]
MHVRHEGGRTVVAGANYEVTILPERYLVLLRRGSFYYGMCLLSAVDSVDRRDTSTRAPEIRPPAEKDGRIELTTECDSSVWARKTHHYLFREDEIQYWTEVEGHARLDRVFYFRGTLDGQEIASVPGFTQVFSPMPNFLEKQEFHASEYLSIAAGNDAKIFETIRGFALHGAPLCYVMHEGDSAPFLSAGILAKPGEYRFHAFEFNAPLPEEADVLEPIVGTQAFSLAYHGHQAVDGAWQTPRLVLQFAKDRFAAVEQYVRRLEAFGGTVKRTAPYQDWTFEPVYCTWHDQVALAMPGMKKTLSMAELEGGNVHFSVLNQQRCKQWLDLLAENGVKPGTFIIDAKWQKNSGDPDVDTTRFPDLRGFIDDCHAQGIRVILWHNGWDREAIPDEECCTIDGKPVKADPTNPAYQQRVKAYVRRMLSDEPGCYNADGLKVDGMTGTPGGAGLKTHGGLAGFELARSLLELLWTSAKAVKQDSAIGQFTGFPYFADLCDVARTGDLYTVKGDPNTTNAFRARIQRIVMPGVAIDTDGAERFNYVLPYEEVLKVQEAIGVPCIYQAEWLLQRRDFCSPDVRRLEAEHYAQIAASWKRYRESRRASKANEGCAAQPVMNQP